MSEKNGAHDINYNLFYYAYKELSQDAIICWLIKWAYYDGPGYEQLRECGKKFLEALFAKHKKKVPESISNPELWLQNNRIDVLARIGDYILLIEDKTGTKDHSNQLEKYYKKVLGGKTSASKVPVEEEFIIPIYLKTEPQSLFDQLRIENLTTYKVFDRKDFLNVMEHYSTAHPLLNDYRNYLKYVDNDTHSYKKWRDGENGKESYRSLQGFFRELENHLVVSDWSNDLVGFNNTQSKKNSLLGNYWKSNWPKNNPWGWNWVPNPSGGFAGFWWYSNTVKSCGHDVSLYLQLELKPDHRDARKLCFKVYMDKPDIDIKWNCHERIIKVGGDLVRKPDRIGHGRTVTIAEWKKPWLVFKPNCGPDIQKTVNNLMEAQSVLDRAESI